MAIDRTRVEQLAEEGHRGARSTLAALRTLSFQLSGAQLGITITSLIVGFLIEPVVAPALEPLLDLVGIPEPSQVGVGVTAGLIIATSLEMVVAELVPKNVAIARPERVAFLIATPLRATNALMKPLIVFLNAAANWTVRLMGIDPRDEIDSVPSLEELQVLIRSSREGGGLAEEEFALLTRSITFGDKLASDALTPRTSVTAISSDATFAELTRVALNTGHSRFPVFEGDIDHVVGVAHVKDGYALRPPEREAASVREIMRPALLVPESRTLESLLLEMRRDRKQMAIVLDEYGGTAGIITLEDLLEEIVGEIEDEYDPRPEMDVTPRLLAGVHRVSGMLRRDDVEQVTGLVIPDGDYETLAGFLLTLFDRIPKVGDQVAYEGWEFKVVEMNGNRIAEVLVAAPIDTDQTA